MGFGVPHVDKELENAPCVFEEVHRPRGLTSVKGNAAAV